MIALKRIIKILKWIFIIIAVIIILLLIVRFIGRKINNQTPEGGINETMYIDVNGQKQWLNFYGEDMDNPVLLYLHGGPGMSTSFGDWKILRKLAKDYTIVNWDQRNCGKTWIENSQDTMTSELLHNDIITVVNYVLEYTDKQKLTILGSSWGTMYGCDFALEHPELVECLICTSLTVDSAQADTLIKQCFLEWSADDPEYHQLAEKFDPYYNYSEENNDILYKLTEKYKEYLPAPESYTDGDINFYSALFFNPYYSLSDLFKIFVTFYSDKYGYAVYKNYLFNQHGEKDFSIMDRTHYEMPVYVLEGTEDSNASIAEDYFNKITAPDKEFRYVTGGHMSPMLQSEILKQYVHEIAQKQKKLH